MHKLANHQPFTQTHPPIVAYVRFLSIASIRLLVLTLV
jgi:hypothetical protein